MEPKDTDFCTNADPWAKLSQQLTLTWISQVCLFFCFFFKWCSGMGRVGGKAAVGPGNGWG